MRQKQYLEVRIVTSLDINHRSFISFYYNNKRHKLYNGNSLGLKIQPNYSTSIEEKNKLLKTLEYELQKALENNSYPYIEETINPSPIDNKSKTTEELLDNALNRKLLTDLSKYYRRNLISIHKHFVGFLTREELEADITILKRARIEEFLEQFNSSGTYYMNKRRDLGVLFSTINKDLDHKLSIIKDTDTRRSTAKLHKIYEQDQIKPILQFLKINYPNLHLCCLLSYGCFLRPHKEVRNLYGYHFKKEYTEIHLAGSDNKGGRIRVVYIPNYVRIELQTIAPFLKQDENLFTSTTEPYNDAYFNTAWTKAWLKMNKLGLIQKQQTIYSFRHTAAVSVYRKTKDLNVLQQLLGHSNMIVTLKYLRGLGEATNEELKNVMPEL